jgi:hypothetical protein
MGAPKSSYQDMEIRVKRGRSALFVELVPHIGHWIALGGLVGKREVRSIDLNTKEITGPEGKGGRFGRHLAH